MGKHTKALYGVLDNKGNVSLWQKYYDGYIHEGLGEALVKGSFDDYKQTEDHKSDQFILETKMDTGRVFRFAKSNGYMYIYLWVDKINKWVVGKPQHKTCWYNLKHIVEYGEDYLNLAKMIYIPTHSSLRQKRFNLGDRVLIKVEMRAYTAKVVGFAHSDENLITVETDFEPRRFEIHVKAVYGLADRVVNKPIHLNKVDLYLKREA